MRRAIALSILAIPLIMPVCLARTWSVPSVGCPTIQAGIDSAGVGDTVLVAAGTYTGEGNRNLDFGGTDLVLISEAGPELTVINCEGSGRGFAFISEETDAAVVEGFTVANGYVVGEGLGVQGGGMCCCPGSPTVINCIFAGNSAGHVGGGIACFGCSPNVSYCTFSGNSANDGGGGMYCDYASPNVTNCTFSGNSGGWGGGILCFIESYPMVSNCTFSNNSGLLGGGMGCLRSAPNLSGCTFSGNSAGIGGGMSCDESSPTVGGCIFSGNSASDDGGGMYCDMSSPIVSNCVFTQNAAKERWGGGVFCWQESSPTVRSCTFSGNSAYDGSGMFCAISSHLLIENTIIAFSPAGSAILCDAGGTFTLNCCDIYGNAGGDLIDCIADQVGANGNFSADPLFCDTLMGDFRLETCSPCLPGNHPDGYDCGVPVGAYCSGCACQSDAAAITWGGIKSIYR